MKRIEFPEKVATFPVVQKDGTPVAIPLTFQKFLRDILSESPVFNGRAGARIANKIEDALDASPKDAKGLTLDDEWVGKLREAVGPDKPAIWASPLVAQAFERFGYYDAIENTKAPAESDIVTKGAVGKAVDNSVERA